MKNIMKLFVYVAAAAMALASCQKNEIDGPVKKEVHFTIKAGISDTKTTITDNGDGTYTPSWTVGDRIGVMFELGDNENKDTEFTAKTVEKGVATFEGKYTFATNDEGRVDGQLYAFYPSAAFNKSYSDGEVRLDLKDVQKPTSSSFDPSCDLLIAKPCDYIAEATGVQTEVVIDNMYFARMMSVLRINLMSEFLFNETVKSVSFNAEGMHLTGAMRFNLAEGTFKGNQTTSGNSEVKAEYSDDPVVVAGEKNSVYLVVAPVTIPSGTTLTFTIETENYDIVKTVTAPSEKVLPVGNVAVINLNIAEENCTAKTEDTSDYSGTYAILAKRTTGGYWYMTNDLGTASTKRFTAVEAGETLPEEDVALGASKLWQVSKSGEGYTVKSVGANQYITWSSGNSANLGDSGILFTITKTDEEFYNLSHSNRYLSLNATSGNNYFALYESQQKNLVLIPAVQGEEPATLSATAPSQMAAAGGQGSFVYTLTNPKDDIQLSATTDATWITDVAVGAENVTYTVSPNESEDTREDVITLTYGDLTETVTISQAGKPAEGGETVEVTIVASELGYSNSADVTDVMNGLLIFAKNTGQNSPKYYDSGTNIRMYDKNTLTVTAPNGGILTSIAFTVSGSYFNLTTAVGTISNKTWTGNTESVTFTNGSNQTRITKIVVTYQIAGGGEEPMEPVQLVMEDVTCTAQTENSLTFTWDDVANATAYEVTCNNKTETVNTTTYTATDLSAGTEYEISVKAVGDGTNYTTSEPKTAKGTTKAAEQGGGETPETKTWKLVTSASTLKAGDKLAIVSTSKGKIASATISDKVMEEISVSIANNSFVSLPSGAAELTLGGSSGSWTLTNASGKKLGATAVKKVAWDSGTMTWTITIAANGDATIQNTTSSYGRFLYNVSSPRFTTYTSNATATMLLPQIYRYE